MNRETLKKIDRFLTFGDIKPKVDETDCYYITDKAMQKVIDGFSKELLEMHRIITMNQLIEVRKGAGQVEPEVKVKLADILQILDDEEYTVSVHSNNTIDDKIPESIANTAIIDFKKQLKQELLSKFQHNVMEIKPMGDTSDAGLKIRKVKLVESSETLLIAHSVLNF